MAPQIIDDVIDWLFGRRRRKKPFYGGKNNWAVPGYGNTGLRRGKAYSRSLPEKDSNTDTGASPVGQTPKVIDFDDGKTNDNNSINNRFQDIDDESYLDNESDYKETLDVDDGFSFVDDDSAEGEFPEKSFHDMSTDNQESSGSLNLSDSVNESTGNSELQDILYESSDMAEASEKMNSDIDDKYYIDEVTGIRVLRFEDRDSLSKNEESSGQEIFQEYGEVSSASEITSDKDNLYDNSKFVITESSTKMDFYKEENMTDSHYVAHNENESNLVQRMHPDCKVMIPDDYDGAIEEIMTCPLDCPYKVLKLAEVDQKTLRSRLLK